MSSSTEDDLQKVLGLPSSDPSANQSEYPHESLDKQMADYYRYEYTKYEKTAHLTLDDGKLKLAIVFFELKYKPPSSYTASLLAYFSWSSMTLHNSLGTSHV